MASDPNADLLTFERLTRLGVAPGWRCLEIARPGGSVARWLAEHVGREGAVTATHIDDPLEPGSYDLVHSRALIEQLPDPRRALERMAGALRPGGWLLVEAADFLPLRSAAFDHPASGAFDRVSRVFVDAMLADGIVDLLLAPRIPALLENLGLVAVDSEGVARVHHGGSPTAAFLERSVERVRERLVARDRLSERDLAAFGRALGDASFSWMAWIRFAAWGQRRPLAA